MDFVLSSCLVLSLSLSSNQKKKTFRSYVDKQSAKATKARSSSDVLGDAQWAAYKHRWKNNQHMNPKYMTNCQGWVVTEDCERWEPIAGIESKLQPTKVDETNSGAEVEL